MKIFWGHSGQTPSRSTPGLKTLVLPINSTLTTSQPRHIQLHAIFYQYVLGLKYVFFLLTNSLTEVDTTYTSIAGLGDKLKRVREENSRHSQVKSPLSCHFLPGNALMVNMYGATNSESLVGNNYKRDCNFSKKLVLPKCFLVM